MAYDEELAERVRRLLAPHAGVTERKMFGGLAFLVDGNMAVAASGQGGLMVRVDPDASERLLETTNARLVEMRGRRMPGWMRVELPDLENERHLAVWVERGIGYARSLPPKR